MNRKIGVQSILFISIFLFISATLSSTVISIPPVTQETIIVDITGNGDFTSIKNAIESADITDIILIKKGTYNEHDLNVKQKIEIIGEDPSNTIINSSGNVAFTLSSSYVDISNLQIINTGEFAISIPPGSIGCTITNCIINTKFKGVAINVRSSYNTISDCNLIGIDNSKQGVKISGNYNIVKNCDMQDFANGVLIITNSDDNQIQNCNIFNCENAIDIRFDSNRNIVTRCNIYSNLQTIKIWLNSNDNFVYLNNFWKNDNNAIDENNNSWDNGAQGNYWDKYRGADKNGDGIGDSPYTISEGNIDRFPLMQIVLPDIISPPGNLLIVTSKSDNTPTFSWTESIYIEGIKGYLVKIDNSPETSIGNVLSWTSIDILSDGVHTFYVRAKSFDNKTSNYSSLTFTIDTTIIDTDGDGWSDSEEQLYGTDPNNPGNYPEDTDNDHIPNSVDTDDDNDGYSDEMESSYGTNSLDINIYPTDTDNDGIPNNDSPDGKYLGDTDDDNDGLSDIDETSLGSNPVNKNDITRIFINGQPYYLVDASQNNVFDILYNPITKATTAVVKQNDKYLIDQNGDGVWDYIYIISNESVSAYGEEPLLPIPTLILIILIISIPISVLIYSYIRKQKIIKLPQKPIVIEKPDIVTKYLKGPLSKKKETVEMITQTKSLLQHIQQDVQVYMEKLKQLENQFNEPIFIEEKKVEPPKEEPTEIKDIHEIEAKIDKILSESNNKKSN
ncbi:MAG: hypothetical protein AYK22_07230 [Thermoplasmatales archaeon SG8-52-3]|nr:MAG: hypothetical protein AYK22_07230 [Thermoplasmatales archaeon SG8-52-3]